MIVKNIAVNKLLYDSMVFISVIFWEIRKIIG